MVSFDDFNNQCFIQMELEIKTVPKNASSTLKTYGFKRDEFFNGELKKYFWTKIVCIFKQKIIK